MGDTEGGDPRLRIGSELDRAHEALARGDVASAIASQRRALDMIRHLAAAEADADEHRHALASTLYAVAELHLTVDDHDEALAALAEGEEVYASLRTVGGATIDGLIADVAVRRARVHVARGAGASAVVSAQSAVDTYLRFGIDDDDPRYLDLARVFAWNAHVLLDYGDPDVAVASADSAIRMILLRATEINRSGDLPLHMRNLLVATRVAAIIHDEAGRADVAASARRIAQQTGGLSPDVIDGWQRPAAARGVTLTAALRRAAEVPGADAAGLPSDVVAPPLDCRIRTSLERSHAGLAPAHAVILARLAAAVLDTGRVADVPVGLRLGLEAHALFAGASLARDVNMRYNLGALGPPWAQVLLRCSRVYERTGDTAMALDLAAWAGGVAMQLVPFALTDASVRALCQECMRHHGHLLSTAGRHEEALDAFSAADRLDG